MSARVLCAINPDSCRLVNCHLSLPAPHRMSSCHEKRCSQFDDGTRQMLALCYQEALQENGCFDLLELQDASQHLSWKAPSANKVTFACYLANKLTIRVEWEPFQPDLIASAPDATLSALACQVKLPLSIQIEGVMLTATCRDTFHHDDTGRGQTILNSCGRTGPEPRTPLTP